MQLGARWSVGQTPHRGVPPELHAEIAAQEARFPAAGSWTLTWLEGRPRCALDELVLVSLDAAGDVTVRELAAEQVPSAIREDELGAGARASDVSGILDDDDDDWLS
ncbi:hypothetical protein EDF60_1286 [Leucobacter luti]|uniref:Fe-S oxidoreductase n=1 Tax=Leucobacter luti TaxID=340320 RepID=UPI00104FC188|nr:Fe-S oxidoreductase [Leucobacter luti]MCW2287797.1 hypothetical protein [Leucobacter luti]TCK46040.1 hypothetical protein EDF60_1286 [Leucobacter luti]